ncbi:hypothetical protein SLNSH_17025 [Alsobacter soli]|uniref:Rap1a immunity protein domain-containing protein n=1 Tax=Alsobacter soli TaxID=2109933 RepID=A0A2T1HQC1_9HYPH|nr:Rap1a/Tai family immunity protein [Alsobacter soli]PSC03812.1 hypothetical protein SLNSH_17025 [Alsobacter soli]
MKAIALALAILTVTASGQAFAADSCETGPRLIRNGFFKGEDLTQMSEQILLAHVMGFVNGVAMAPFMNAPHACTEQFHACIEGRTNSQLVAQLRKYLQDHPERWHEDAHHVLWSAIFAPCAH